MPKIEMALRSGSITPLNHVCDISPITNVLTYSGPITSVISTLADRLRTARTEAELRQEQLASLAGVSQGTIANLEAGTRKNPRELLAIARALGVNAEWLKTGKGPMRPSPTEVTTSVQTELATYGSTTRAKSGLAYHISELGTLLSNVDDVRRGAIAELLSALARNPDQAEEIGAHVTALVGSKAKRAA